MKYGLKVTGAGVIGGCLGHLACVGYTFALSETWNNVSAIAVGAYFAMIITMIITDDHRVQIPTAE